MALEQGAEVGCNLGIELDDTMEMAEQTEI